jgi:CheY-like chemotaxis protein
MSTVSSGTQAATRCSSFPVLVVDDSPTDKELACVYLAQAWPFEHDLEVDCASDGREALEKIRTRRFALVVLDWRLPIMGDGHVLRQLRAEGVRLPVVVVSGLSREEIDADLEALGAAFVHKNHLNPGSLYRAIAVALQLLGFPLPPRPARQA